MSCGELRSWELFNLAIPVETPFHGQNSSFFTGKSDGLVVLKVHQDLL